MAAIILIHQLLGDAALAVAFAAFAMVLPVNAFNRSPPRWSWKSCALAGVACYACIAIFVIVDGPAASPYNVLLWVTSAVGVLTWSAEIVRLRRLPSGDRSHGSERA